MVVTGKEEAFPPVTTADSLRVGVGLKLRPSMPPEEDEEE